MADGDLHRLFTTHLPDGHWQRVELGAIGPGVPDTNYVLDGSEGWIEYKKAQGIRIDIRPAQVAWLTRRADAGGRVWIAVRRRTARIDSLYLFHGNHAMNLIDRDFRDVAAMGIWDGGPQQWDWNQIREILVEKGGYGKWHKMLRGKG
jgi:hypothetical protein